MYFNRIKYYYKTFKKKASIKKKMNKLSCLANVKRNESSIRPEVPPDVVFAAYVGDCSGSMTNQEDASANGVYEWVKEMCSGVNNNNQEGYISVTFFDKNVYKRMENVNMKDVELSMEDAREWSRPRGSTKLYDTAIMDINKLRKRIKSYNKSHPTKKVSGVFQLFSDGYDNASTFSDVDLKRAIEDAKKEGIVCIYLGIGQDALAIGQSYGFNVDQSLSVDIGEETSVMAFRGCSMNAMRSATTGTPQTIPQCLRQSSAPSQFHQQVSPFNSPSLRQSAVPPPPMINLRQAAGPPPPMIRRN
jgi:hypothetical protein